MREVKLTNVSLFFY